MVIIVFSKVMDSLLKKEKKITILLYIYIYLNINNNNIYSFCI